MIEKSIFKGGLARAEINFFLIVSIVWYYFIFANDIFSDSKGSKLNLRAKFEESWCTKLCLTLSWRRLLSYRNQSIDWRVNNGHGLRHERVKTVLIKLQVKPATSLKKKMWYKYFPVNFAKFSKDLFYRTPLDDCFWTYWKI